MSEPKKKMSVAEILAAARKQGGAQGSSEAAPPAAEPSAPESPAVEASAEAAAPVSAEAPVSAKAAPTAPKPAAKPAAGGKMSVAEILAAARANKGAGAAEAPAVEKPKPAAKPAPKPATAAAPKESPAPAPAGSGVKDTQSILAAARSGAKPGPMSKAEAAAKANPAAPAAKAKGPVEAPPMPAKPAYAKPKAKAEADEDRRGVLGFLLGSFLGIGFTSLSATAGLWTLGTARFMFPNILTEPPSRFKVGFPADFAPGSVETKFVAQFGVWVVNSEYQGKPQIFALRTVCTHLGCTPNWLEGEQKFKCPCHGSGFYKDGINFEGPAPRPLERYAIRLADDGQIEIDKSKMFQEELGQWANAETFIPV
jgi:cytochrome b6-f complex iron-sulfur subunit